jgi:hypothetical protein
MYLNDCKPKRILAYYPGRDKRQAVRWLLARGEEKKMDLVDFFISYNKADEPWAIGIGHWLDQAMYTSIRQSQDFVAGSNFVSEMHNALQRAQRVIAVVSPSFLDAPFPQSEWTAAFARDPTGQNRTLLLVRIYECNPPGLLRPLVYIDLVGLDHHSAREKFLSEIKAALAGKRMEQPSRKLRDRPVPTLHQEIKGNGNIQAAGPVIITEKHTTKNVVEPGPEHISEEQAAHIKELVDKLAETDVLSGRPDSHGAWYSRLYKKFKVTSYLKLRKEQYEGAVSYLRVEAAKARPKLRRTDNKEWRKRFYSGIWGKAKALGLSRDDVHQLATERLSLKKPLRSLTELGEQNLEKFYGIIMRM